MGSARRHLFIFSVAAGICDWWAVLSILALCVLEEVWAVSAKLRCTSGAPLAPWHRAAGPAGSYCACSVSFGFLFAPGPGLSIRTRPSRLLSPCGQSLWVLSHLGFISLTGARWTSRSSLVALQLRENLGVSHDATGTRWSLHEYGWPVTDSG